MPQNKKIHLLVEINTVCFQQGNHASTLGFWAPLLKEEANP